MQQIFCSLLAYIQWFTGSCNGWATDCKGLGISCCLEAGHPEYVIVQRAL